MEAVFCAALFFVAYPYLLYPALLGLLPPARRRAGEAARDAPSVTVLMAVHNEQRGIAAKLDDLLSQQYAAGRLDVIVVSDASTDQTDRIVGGYAEAGVRLIRAPKRLGKIAAQNLAIPLAAGEILVFTDAATRFPPGTVAALVEPFADPRIGCVSTEDRLEGEGGEGLYTRYEMMLRRLEARFHSMVGASGSGYAVRRGLMGIWPGGFPNDFITPLKVIEAGYRAISEPRAVGVYPEVSRAREEFRRKVRTVIRGMATLFAMRSLLNPVRFPRTAFVLVSHKILRWSVPLALALLFASSAMLAGRGPLWELAWWGQIVFYALAALGAALAPLRAIAPIRVAHFFLVVNAAIALAWVRYAMGERAVAWEPTRRQEAS